LPATLVLRAGSRVPAWRHGPVAPAAAAAVGVVLPRAGEAPAAAAVLGGGESVGQLMAYQCQAYPSGTTTVLDYWDEYINHVQPLGDNIKAVNKQLFSKRKVVWDAVKQLHSSSSGITLDQAAAALEELRREACFNMQDFIEVLRARAPSYTCSGGSSESDRAVRDRLLKQAAKTAADAAVASELCPLRAGIAAADKQKQQGAAAAGQQQPVEASAIPLGGLAAALATAKRKHDKQNGSKTKGKGSKKAKQVV
jgi:hypothetical protein